MVAFVAAWEEADDFASGVAFEEDQEEEDHRIDQVGVLMVDHCFAFEEGQEVEDRFAFEGDQGMVRPFPFLLMAAHHMNLEVVAEDENFDSLVAVA